MSERVDSTARVDEGLPELRGSLAGDVLAPEDARYDAARRCFNAPSTADRP